MFGRQPVAQPHAQFLYALDTPDSSRQVGAEETAVCGFLRQAANRLQPEVDRPRGRDVAAPEDHRLIEGEPWLGAIPVQFVDGVAMAPLLICAR